MRHCWHTWFWVVPFVLGGCLLFGCNSQPSSPATPHHVSVEQVSLTTADNVKLAGALYVSDQSAIAVVLAHQRIGAANQTTWQPFAQSIAEQGYSALTFDFRGFGQSSGSVKTASDLVTDMETALSFLHDRGYQRVVCVGASQGGTTCLQVAAEGMVVGVATISSPMSMDSTLTIHPDQFAKLSVPKLYLCADADTVKGRRTGLEKSTRSMYDMSPEPKTMRLLPGTAHGTDLFDTPAGAELHHQLVKFLEDVAHQAK